MTNFIMNRPLFQVSATLFHINCQNGCYEQGQLHICRICTIAGRFRIDWERNRVQMWVRRSKCIKHSPTKLQTSIDETCGYILTFEWSLQLKVCINNVYILKSPKNCIIKKRNDKKRYSNNRVLASRQGLESSPSYLSARSLTNTFFFSNCHDLGYTCI